MTEAQIIAELEAEGFRVVFRPFHLAGAYHHATRTIIIDSRLPAVGRLSTLAHEAIHARMGHDGHQKQDIEKWVDERAARLLISPAAYAAAEQTYGEHVGTLAAELGVTETIIRAYRRTLISLPGFKTRLFIHKRSAPHP